MQEMSLNIIGTAKPQKSSLKSSKSKNELLEDLEHVDSSQENQSESDFEEMIEDDNKEMDDELSKQLMRPINSDIYAFLRDVLLHNFERI